MPDPEQLIIASPAHNNQHLFSDHYLNEILRQRIHWQALVDEARPAMEQVAAIFERFVPSSNEAQTEEDLVKPVLRLLNHDFEVQPSLSTPEGAKRPDYVFYEGTDSLNANKNQTLTDALPEQGGIAVGDAKHWNRPLDIAVRDNAGDALLNKNPSYQISYYMQHSGVTWGILTNGKLWRLYHKDTAFKLDHFYEVDLQELAAAGDVERFLYFYAFFRRPAFDDGPVSISAILRESTDYARKVGDSLKEQVYDALRHIAQGFLDYGPNQLEPDQETLNTIYDSSLILLYRLIFILYAEARELLPVRENAQYRDDYSLHAVKRDTARALDSGRRLLADSALVWPRLEQLFDTINRGNPPLSVATFNGGLFDPTRHEFLLRCKVGDSHLQRAIDKLARVERAFVDYRDLSVQHMGTIYEGLLEHRLRSLPVREDEWVITLVNDKGERKSTGSYYTPDDIVKYIVERTVGPVLERAIEGKADDTEKLDAALKVNVLDPAMGSGHFLVEATEFIARFLVDHAILPEGKTADEADLAYWKRRVVQSCIYGVDLNPLAVELAKLSLWLTTVAKGRPLSFLDHHLRPGNSLVGSRLEHLEVHTTRSKRAKRTARQGDGTKQIALLADTGFAERISTAVDSMWRIETSESEDVSQVKQQEETYEAMRRLLVDKYGRWLNLVTAARFGVSVGAWLWPTLVDKVKHNSIATVPAVEKLVSQANEIAARLGFFHWELEFPEIYFDREGHPLDDGGGFEAVVGNPPWERIKLQENEFFAARDREIAHAPRAADRKRLISTLPRRKPELWREYETAKETADNVLAYTRDTGFYPLMGKGDTNLYAVFAERALQLMGKTGRMGLLVPSGIATDDTTKEYFQHLVNHRMLAELLDFENREGMFPEVDSRFKFSIMLATGEAAPEPSIRCGFYLHGTRQIADPERISWLSAEDFRLFNPNTLTCPVFRRSRDVELTRQLYAGSPVLLNRPAGEEGSPWCVSFQRMFDMTNDSRLFRTAAELEAEGYWLGAGNVYTKGLDRCLPLYEGKMVQLYDHRAAGVVVNPGNLHRPAQEQPTSDQQHLDPHFSPTPQFWVDSKNVFACCGEGEMTSWFMGYKDVTSPTNVRTMIPAIIPATAVGNTFCLIHVSSDLRSTYGACMLANLSSFALDFAARQKVGGQHLNFFIVEQLPVLPPETYDTEWHGVWLADFAKERVLELCYTAYDLKGFADDLGYDGSPFAWDEERRFHLRCQLDALYFHLYKLSRDEAGEILDTFPIAKRQDEARYERFRTKDLILSYYSAYAAGNMDAWVSG